MCRSRWVNDLKNFPILPVSYFPVSSSPPYLSASEYYHYEHLRKGWLDDCTGPKEMERKTAGLFAGLCLMN